ncbi:hypothetical protein [Actinopolyspora mortivallis]|nr:hypothetical protein [Actinopolyspora mortivallis]
MALPISFLIGFFSVKIWPDNLFMQRAVAFLGMVVVIFFGVLAYFHYAKK